MKDDKELLDAQERTEERMCRKMPHRALEGQVGIVEKVYRGRSTGILKAKVIWDSGRVSYELLGELNVF